MNQFYTIPRGYRIEKRQSTVGIDTAEEWLTTKKQRRYTEAIRQGGAADLISHVLICPYCGYELPAYARYTRHDHSISRLPKPIVEEWATRQISLFEPTRKKLFLNAPENMKAEYVCGKCGYTSQPSNSYRGVYINRTPRTLEISCEICGLSELFAAFIIPSGSFSLSFPLYESVVFNFENGHTFIQLTNTERHKPLAVYDLTSDCGKWQDGVVYQLLAKNKTVQRAVRWEFISRWHGDLPYPRCELMPERYILLTRFIGYPRSFYNAVPFTGQSRQLDGSFKPIAALLHNAASVFTVYETSLLPQMKSIRKVYFENPGLFFYLREGEKLWSILKDPNLFRGLLTDGHIYDVFSELHLYPAIFDFYADYCRIKSSGQLCYHLKSCRGALHQYALRYCLLNKNMKAKEQKEWQNKGFRFPQGDYDAFLYQNEVYSIPKRTEQNIQSCVINGYLFTYLQSSYEYQKAGRILDNCLANWTNEQNPVIAVLKGGVFSAAIEIEGNKIIQAKSAHNRELADNPCLYASFEKWRMKFGLTFDSSLQEAVNDGCGFIEDQLF